MPVVDHHAGVAVVEADLVVVGGDQQRLAGIPAVGPRQHRVIVADPPGGEGAPVLDAARSAPVCAQQPVPVERLERGGRVPALGGFEQRRAADDDIGAYAVELRWRQLGAVGDLDQLDLGRVGGAQHLEGVVGPAVLDRGCQQRDAAGRREPPVGRQRRHRHARIGVGQVPENRACLDRGELIRVADEHQPGRRSKCLQQPGHHRQRHHRRLVDHDDLDRQPVGAVVPEPAARLGPPAEQPVQRGRRQLAEPLLVIRQQLPGRRPHRLLQSRSRLAGWRRQRDPPLRVLLLEQREQPAHRRRLAGARSAGQHADPGERAGLGRCPLVAVAGVREQPCEPGGKHGQVEVVRLRRRSLAQLGGDLLLLVPVPRQPQPRPDHPQRAVSLTIAHQRARGAAGHPVVRPVQRHVRHRHLGLVVDVRAGRLLGGREVEHHRAVPGRAHHERGREQHRVVALTADRAEPSRDVHIGGGQDASLVERREQPFRAQGERRVIGRGHGLPASRSDSPVTSPVGGRHENTPGAAPSASTTPGPDMPRRNR